MATRCSLCEVDGKTTKHHVYPKSAHSMLQNSSKNKKYTTQLLNTTIPLCRFCHTAIHQIYTNEQLALDFYSLELLLAQPKVMAFLQLFTTLNGKKQKLQSIDFLLRKIGISSVHVIDLMDDSDEDEERSPEENKSRVSVLPVASSHRHRVSSSAHIGKKWRLKRLPKVIFSSSSSSSCSSSSSSSSRISLRSPAVFSFSHMAVIDITGEGEEDEGERGQGNDDRLAPFESLKRVPSHANEVIDLLSVADEEEGEEDELEGEEQRGGNNGHDNSSTAASSSSRSQAAHLAASLEQDGFEIVEPPVASRRPRRPIAMAAVTLSTALSGW